MCASHENTLEGGICLFSTVPLVVHGPGIIGQKLEKYRTGHFDEYSIKAIRYLVM